MSNVGKFLKVDNATLKRERLQFARVLVEVDVSKSLLDEIVFKNEKGEEIVSKLESYITIFLSVKIICFSLYVVNNLTTSSHSLSCRKLCYP